MSSGEQHTKNQLKPYNVSAGHVSAPVEKEYADKATQTRIE